MGWHSPIDGWRGSAYKHGLSSVVPQRWFRAGQGQAFGAKEAVRENS
jgi:hypothetical protein